MAPSFFVVLPWAHITLKRWCRTGNGAIGADPSLLCHCGLVATAGPGIPPVRRHSTPLWAENLLPAVEAVRPVLVVLDEVLGSQLQAVDASRPPGPGRL